MCMHVYVSEFLFVFFVNIQADLTRQQNEFKIKLKELEDSLLSRLSSAGGNFLGDTALVENLEITKRTAQEIEQKVLVLSPPLFGLM